MKIIKICFLCASLCAVSCNRVADSLVEAFSGAIICIISISFATLRTDIFLTMDVSVLEQLIDFVENEDIRTSASFWNQIDSDTAIELETSITTSYNELDNTDKEKLKTIGFYKDIFARGLIEVAQKNLIAKSYKFYESYNNSKNQTVGTYTILVTIENSKSVNDQAVSTCQ